MSLEFFVSLCTLGFIVGIHEFGHYLFARMCNVGVEIFSVGFGPIIWSKIDQRGTKWQVCLIPLGGYIHPKDDMQNDKMNKTAVTGLRFKEAGLIRGCLVAFAGPLFNFLSAFCCLLFICLKFGAPQISNKVNYVKLNSPAEKAQLLVGDKILKIQHLPFDPKTKIIEKTANPVLQIDRNGLVLNLQVNKKAYKPAGISFSLDFYKISIVKSLEYSFLKVVTGVFDVLSQIWTAIASFGVMGPIGIIKSAMHAQSGGIISFLLFIVSISIAIGATNLLPIPMLDGGRIIMFIISGIIRRPIPIVVEKILNYVSLGLIAGIFAIGFFVDIKGIIS